MKHNSRAIINYVTTVIFAVTTNTTWSGDAKDDSLKTEKNKNYLACINGYVTCNRSMLSADQSKEVTIAEKKRNYVACINGYVTCNRSMLSEPERSNEPKKDQENEHHIYYHTPDTSSPNHKASSKAEYDANAPIDAITTPPDEFKVHQPVGLKVTYTLPDENGETVINVQTGTDTISLQINGKEHGRKADGIYSVKNVARIGQDTLFTITAIDINGNSQTETVTISRQLSPETEKIITLKPEAIKRAKVRDAIAIIIGIQDYKRMPKAEFANNDATEFHEYAIRALGIRQENIKMLLDDNADDVNILKAFENWLPIKVNKDQTDVYVFYSGHGLPAPDGKSLYFLPHGADKELLSRTAVAQNEIVAALTAAKPKSVTMFIDACYSGQTRGGAILLANAKPVVLKSDTNAYPTNFTVITASANDQISSSSPDLKHGIFSFYLMKGMEGDADANQDGKITVGEIQDYLSDKVSRQAMTLNRKQNPQLFGESERILLRR
jgi:hypothetical protein